MPFMVIYRTADGSSSFEQSDAIDEAALFVERLRNSEGIDQIRIYRLEEISFAFRPYYKVELGMPDRQRGGLDKGVAASGRARSASQASIDVTGGGDAQESTPAEEPTTSVDTEPVETGEDPAAEDVGLNGRRGLFGR